MPTILLVEDDAFIAEIYEKKLSASELQVDRATTGREVLKKVNEKAYDLVLLDLVLPEMSGLEVLKEIKGKPAEYPQHPRIVIFSNLSSPEDRAQATQAGADGFISKTDFTPSQVVDEVKRYLTQFSEQLRNEQRASAGGAPGSVTNGATSAVKRILFIEDEEVFVEMFGKRLTDEGYLVISEMNGKKGLERLSRDTFDLVITDFMLPGMTGTEIVDRVKGNPATENLPIFLLTASLEEAELKKLEATGLVEGVFLKTKITPTELTEAVSDFFKKH